MSERIGNETRLLTLPYSEVCMHMKVAGTQMYGELLPHNMVQLYDLEGRSFSFPITAGEAGVGEDQVSHRYDVWWTGSRHYQRDMFYSRTSRPLTDNERDELQQQVAIKLGTPPSAIDMRVCDVNVRDCPHIERRKI